MDFVSLLRVAKKNNEIKQNERNYYCTKYSPPKKEIKERKLSLNIQKFLETREREEMERKREKEAKLANLLAMRDDKAKNKIRRMLKVTKSANKSVMDEMKNSKDTAVTLYGVEQPDQDDYGYVSREATELYMKYIDKVKDVKEDKSFAPISRPKSLRELSKTKERVKAAIKGATEEQSKNGIRQRNNISTTTTITTVAVRGSKQASSVNLPRTCGTTSGKALNDAEAERREEAQKERAEDEKKTKQRKPPPPSMDFQSLLKLAEKKQHEPMPISFTEIPKKKTEPERLLSAKERREQEERQKKLERTRREREHEREQPNNNSDKLKERKDKDYQTNGVNRMESNGRILKLNQMTIPGMSSVTQNFLKAKPARESIATITTGKQVHSNTSVKSNQIPNRPTASAVKSIRTPPQQQQSTASTDKTKIRNPYAHTKNSQQTREFPPRDIAIGKTRLFPPADVQQRSKQMPVANERRETINGYTSVANRKSAVPVAPKRRIYDDDDEYDSELEDFIDDGDCEEDYSSYIRDIFGYDRQKYQHIDDDDDDNMESNFAQVQREEYISKKIGIQEDLDDMRQEAIEKKLKKQKMKRLRVSNDNNDNE